MFVCHLKNWVAPKVSELFDNDELPIFDNVFDEPEIVLFVSVFDVSVTTALPVAIVNSVPLKDVVIPLNHLKLISCHQLKYLKLMNYHRNNEFAKFAFVIPVTR